jgi:glycine cleavage system H protein
LTNPSTNQAHTSGMLIYKRARFATRLPTDRLYTRSHYWLLEIKPAVWRIGFTKFATRMLGDIVEYHFEVEPGNRVELGQKIGWIEGFKALSDVYSVAEGDFGGGNAELSGDITLLESDPYQRGWLYQVTGRSEPDSVDANGYATILDATIDKMLAGRHEGENHG